MSFKTIGMGVALTCGTLAVGSSLGVSPAQAYTLKGAITVGGPATVGPSNVVSPTNPNDVTIKWSSSNKPRVTEAEGDFSSLWGNLVTIKDLALTRIGSASTINDYKFGGLASFIDFGLVTLKGKTKSLTFDLNAGELTRTIKPNSITLDTDKYFPDGITGVFKFGGSTIAKGELNGRRVFIGNQSSGDVGVSLVAESVPEPLTILGSITALGMGVALKKKQVQNLVKKKVTA